MEKTYRHGSYHAFNISDPKPRKIHKAGVRDRLLHHAVYRMFYPFFNRTFIPDSYSCRVGKGTHKAVNRFRDFGYKVSKNNTRTAWVLKCDVRKFFASVDQRILMGIVKRYIPDENIIWLVGKIVDSFNSGKPGKGSPFIRWNLVRMSWVETSLAWPICSGSLAFGGGMIIVKGFLFLAISGVNAPESSHSLYIFSSYSLWLYVLSMLWFYIKFDFLSERESKL